MEGIAGEKENSPTNDCLRIGILTPVVENRKQIYQPSAFARSLFQDKFLNHIITNSPKPYYESPLGFNKDEIRYTILLTGLADFDKPYKNLSSADVVKLYCYFNMRKHYFTSYSILERITEINEIYRSGRPIKFIDLGCGPATSGIAFVDLIFSLHGRPVVFDYFGVDTSKSMRAEAGNMLNNEAVDERSSIRLKSSWDEILIQELRGAGCIIINASYLFASPSVDLTSLSHFVSSISAEYSKIPIIFVFQNPNDTRKNKNYFQFKKTLGNYTLRYSAVEKIRYSNTGYNESNEVVFFEILTIAK